MSQLRGRHILGASLALLLVSLAWSDAPDAGPATVERYIEFRDGSLLRLPVLDEEINLSVVRPEGRIGNVTVRWSGLQRLTFTPERVFEKKRELLATVGKMGDDDFQVRERAQADLIKMGPTIRGELEAAVE